MKLNLGCCDNHRAGYVNVDIVPPADQIVDLSVPWPWEDSSIEEIIAHDIIEHLPEPKRTMNEAWRVLKPDGLFDIDVPTTDGRGAWQDPGHLSFWNRNSFFYYEHGNPHLHRFAPQNGVRCAFRVVSSKESFLKDGVTKLHIVLAAVKP